MSDETDRINLLERLPRRRSPERDLWPGIEARLTPRRSPVAVLSAAVRSYPLLQFALAASLVAGLASVFTLGLRDVAVPGGAAATAFAPQLNEHSRAIVEANLSIVEQAERQLKQALRQHPDSDSLHSLLESTRHRARDLRALL